jgi:hypothetical protein
MDYADLQEFRVRLYHTFRRCQAVLMNILDALLVTRTPSVPSNSPSPPPFRTHGPVSTRASRTSRSIGALCVG